VYEEEIHPALDGLFEGHEPGIDSGTDLGDAPVVGDLKAVDCTRIILERGAAGAAITEIDQLLERRGGHGGEVERRQGAVQVAGSGSVIE